MKYRRGLVLAALLSVSLAACSSGGSDTTTTTSTTFPTNTTAAPATTTVPATTTPSTTIATTTTSLFGGATLLTTVIQQELRVLGHFHGEPDGILGPVTEEAIIAFQTEAGITADGQYGPQTYVALADELEANEDFVTAVQEDLMELDLYSGPADGDYGEGTVKGVEALQEQCEMNVDGRLTPKTHVCLEQETGRA